jgi:competence protein ComEC
VKHNLRLLLPAIGLWVGAFVQSLLVSVANLQKVFILIGVALTWWIVRRKIFGVFLIACLFGAILLALHQSALQREFFSERAGQVVGAQLVVTSDVRALEGGVRGDFRQRDRYLVEVKSRQIDGTNISVPLLLFGDDNLARLIPGQRVEVLGRVALFPGYATVAGYLTQVGALRQLDNSSWLWRWSSSIRSEIKKSLATLPRDARALIPGLVIGDRSEQDRELTAVMRRSGLTHLTAVSGANFAIVAAFLLLIGRTLRIRGRGLWIGIALSLTIFIFLVRPSSSVMRAAVMTGVLLIARARGLRAAPISALATAISLLLLINPFYVRDAGFALSVFATAGLLFLAPAITKWLTAKSVHDFIAEALAIPISATIFCLPIIVLLSGELSLISILANFLVAPVIAVITGSGLTLMIVAPLSISLGSLIGWMITPFALWIAGVARTLSALPFAAMHWPQSWIGSLAALALISVLALIIRSKRRIALLTVGGFLALQILFALEPFARSWIPKDWQIFQCDVGQGDALVLRTGISRAILIDVGPEEKSINRCLTMLGITSIELLILTHFHADHVAGLAGALPSRTIDRVWISPTASPPEESQRVRNLLRGSTLTSPRVGDGFSSDGVQIQVIAVAAETNPNDSSISILANINGLSLFAAGDLESEGQARALASLKRLPSDALWNRSPIDFMKGIHHGSAIQDRALLALLRPRVSVFSVGAENPYGHPTQSALELYGQYGAVYRTDEDASLALAKRAGNLIVVTAPPSLWAS